MSRRFEQDMTTSILPDLQFPDGDEAEHGDNGMQGFVFDRGDEAGPTRMAPPCEPQDEHTDEAQPERPVFQSEQGCDDP